MECSVCHRMIVEHNDEQALFCYQRAIRNAGYGYRLRPSDVKDDRQLELTLD